MNRLRDYVLKNLNSIRIVSFFTFFVGIITYYIFIITGYTNSDGLGEGLYYYSHANFHSENGRWAVRFFNFLFGHNVVMPLYKKFPINCRKMWRPGKQQVKSNSIHIFIL